ncbi:hemerythrin domain-containing protein [Sphingosinicella sp. LHD-64]|uniref:hemerythrin domain-containing protein n=1 Tax=Sphingosinicella sp. LHD-64 TaxID=3072139 RepID=UPI00280E64DC|nr:hemerythrin domain-containing protein [Sphingosinicella sp. LHD-64]MDQ8755131.1 hemerythrin domain-containing protein [Sphingosinicella sp. LHD-64]
MATKTRESTSRQGNRSRPAFTWSAGSAGTLAAAAVAGAAVGLAANLGRKFVVQGLAGASGDWAETLANEHAMVLALFDKIEATENHQTTIRKHLLTKVKNALGKHAIEEENVIYPALRDANSAHDADALNAEHGYVKTFLYELENMEADSPEWLAKIRDFRSLLQKHMQMEEREVFPALKRELSDEQNARLFHAMSREGMKLA